MKGDRKDVRCWERGRKSPYTKVQPDASKLIQVKGKPNKQAQCKVLNMTDATRLIQFLTCAHSTVNIFMRYGQKKPCQGSTLGLHEEFIWTNLKGELKTVAQHLSLALIAYDILCVKWSLLAGTTVRVNVIGAYRQKNTILNFSAGLHDCVCSNNSLPFNQVFRDKTT